MQFPCEKRVWKMLAAKDRAFLQAVFQYGMSYRALAALTSVSYSTVSRKAARLMMLLRNERLIALIGKAQGRDLYLLKLRYVYGLSANRIAKFSGIVGDFGGRGPKAIRRRLRRIEEELGKDGD